MPSVPFRYAVATALGALALALPNLFAAEPIPNAVLRFGQVFWAVVLQQGIMLGAALFCLYQARARISFRFDREILQDALLRAAIITPLVGLTCFAVSWGYRQITGHELPVQDVFGWLENEHTPKSVLLLISAAAVVTAPVVEEIYFRGVLFNGLLSRLGGKTSLLLCGIVFAVVHGNAGSFAGLVLIGAFLAHSYRATRSLMTPVIVHACFNLVSLLVFLFGGGE